MYRAAQGNAKPETGFIGDLANLVGTIIDTAAGTPQKEERAAIQAARQAQAELELEKLQSAQKAGVVGQWVPGVPNWLLLLGGAGLGYYLLQDGKA